MPFDSFYKGLNQDEKKNVANYNFDHPNALDFDLAYENLCKLSQNQECEIPVYCFTTHSRKPETVIIKPQPIIIFEGIFAFHEERLRNLMDIKIFVIADDDIRLLRRIKRDVTERGRDVYTILS